MLQSTDERLLRAAGRFKWTLLRLRIAEAVILREERYRDVAAALDTTESTVGKETCLARKQLHQMALDECDLRAFTPDAQLEIDPEGLDENARALMYANRCEGKLVAPYETCREAVQAVGHY